MLWSPTLSCHTLCAMQARVYGRHGRVAVAARTLLHLTHPSPRPHCIADYFQESERDPANDPITLWMNGELAIGHTRVRPPTQLHTHVYPTQHVAHTTVVTCSWCSYIMMQRSLTDGHAWHATCAQGVLAARR
jgi:hypothetical protein